LFFTSNNRNKHNWVDTKCFWAAIQTNEDMANEINDKLFVIVENAKKQQFKNAIKFAETISKKRLEEFSYIRNNQAQYCDWPTVRDYIYYAKEIGILNDDFTAPDEADYNSKFGFNSWLGDIVLRYLKDKNLSLTDLQNNSLDLINTKKLPTADNLYDKLNPDISEKHFKWALLLLYNLKPLTITLCRKWIYLPAKTFDF
jgi:hypothetical protein